jgi:hypothetical protein
VRRHYGRKSAYTGRRASIFRLARLGAVLAVVAVGLWFAVVIEVSATNGVSVEPILHTAQLVSSLAFAGGFVLALWNLALVPRASRWAVKLYAFALAAAFTVMLWVALSYHLIGISGAY